MTTEVLLVWQTYFVFCVYANNFGNFIGMPVVRVKC